MARSTDPKKAALWQRRFRRFLDSGLPVGRFCAAERVSESSFYYWQKKLGPLRRDERGLGAKDRAAGRGDRPAAANGRDRPAAADRRGRPAGTEDRRVFQPVTVVPPPYGVVVHLPGGARIEIYASQLDTIRAVVAEMARADHDLTPQQNMPSTSPVIRKRGDVRPC